MAAKIIFFLILITIAIVFLSQAHLFDGATIQPFLHSLFSPSPFSLQNTSQNTGGGSGSTIASQKVPDGFTRAELSPYFGMVRITTVRLPQTPSPSDYEQVSLKAAGSGKAIDLGEWYLQSNRGYELIPYAVHSLDFVSPQPPAPVSLGNGEMLNIYSTVSPISVNFRMNACSGYLNTEYPFAPPLRVECPAINRRDIVTFTGVCQEFILSLPACQSVVRPAPIPPKGIPCFTPCLDS